MRSIRGGQAFGAAAFVLLLGVLSPACRPSAGSYCNKVCDCRVCEETERLDCVDSVNNARQESEDKQCSEQFNAYFSCINSATTCVSNKVQATGCEAEADALSKCGGPVVLGGNACDQFASVVESKFTSCGIEIPPDGGETAECTDELARQSKCFLPCYQDMDCIVLIDPSAPEAQGPTQSFTDCIVKCQ
jgi:hypothetical protein